MGRCFLAVAAMLAGIVRAVAADDLTACSDQKLQPSEIVAACGRAISSGQFSGATLRDLYASRGKQLFGKQQADSAYDDFNRAMQIDPKNVPLLEWIFLSAVSSGKVDEAVVLAKRILAIDKNHRMSHLVLGVYGIQSKQFAAAQRDARQSAGDAVANLVAALVAGWASAAGGDSKTALATVDKLSGPDWYVAFRELHAGFILDLAGRQAEAGARYERAAKLDASMLRPADAYGRWLSRNRDAATAQSFYEALDRKLPRLALVRDPLRRLRAGEKLAPLFDSAQAGAAEALYDVGWAVTRSGHLEHALFYLQLALYLEPAHEPALIALAELHAAAGNPQLAIDTLRRISTASVLWRSAQIQLATSLDAADRTDEAARLLRSMIADEPGDIVAQVALGNIERGRKKFAECGLTYSGVIDALPKGDPTSWQVYYFRGVCRERTRQWPLAEADMRKALELQPDEPTILNYLGYSLIDQGLKTDEALSLIQRAVARKPDDGYIVDSLGWANFRTGNFAEAEKHLRRAAELVPKDPTIRHHVGDVYWKLGRKSQARAEWTEALRLKPEPDEAAELEERIRNGLPDSPAVSPAQVPVAAAQVEAPRSAQAAIAPVPKASVPAGRRVALVIGNSGYRSVPMLANPSRDSRAVADALKQVGFQSVTLVGDASRDRMVEALRAFATEADKADWALIYYAGHGIEVGGQNYLIPVDARLASDRDVQYEAVSLEQVMSAAEGASKLRLVLLDACRDNPFANMMKRSTASRSVGRGLGQVEPDAGTLLVYAAKHGQIAFDGDGQNSPFVSSFIKRIATPQIEIRKLFDLVRDDVMTATRRQQQPFTYGSVPGSEDFYFLAAEAGGKP